MHIVNSCANDTEHTKTINRVKSANYHFNTFSASVSLCSLIFLQKALPDDLSLNVILVFKKNSFQVILTKLLPHAHFRIRIFNPITLSGIWLFNLAPVRNM